ncbi:hypothetical protein NIES4101_26920 (plasmid) [Calothrix sp. NIES-4101]|nr:hypothetical protein NIES4101_26920 [Calothrix sp. NIES-4101]
MSERISKAKIPEALDALRALSAKELDDVSARDAIRKMRRQIERVLRLGYTYEEVSATLAGLDINISGERIKYLLNDIRKKTRKKSKVSRDDGVEKNSDEIDIPENSEMKESSQLNTSWERNQKSGVNQSSENNQNSGVNKHSEAREISAASTSPTFTRNNQKSSSSEPDKQLSTAKPKNDKNNSRDDIAFPMLVRYSNSNE